MVFEGFHEDFETFPIFEATKRPPRALLVGRINCGDVVAQVDRTGATRVPKLPKDCHWAQGFSEQLK